MSSRIMWDTLTWLTLLAKEYLLFCKFVFECAAYGTTFRAGGCQSWYNRREGLQNVTATPVTTWGKNG
jgi:hypothetical protein